jgi:hypothetical protein
MEKKSTNLEVKATFRFGSTFCKFHKGFSGMPAAVFRSFSRHYHYRESHANPYVTCNFPLCAIEIQLQINYISSDYIRTIVYLCNKFIK